MLIAWDTETTLIPDRQTIRSKSGEEIKVSPYVTPTLVVGTAASSAGRRWFMDPSTLRATLADWLRDPEVHLICQNLVFDLDVVCKEDAALRPLFNFAAAVGRLHDTMLLDFLLRLAQGQFDKPRYRPENGVWAPDDARVRSLDKIAWEYCGITLNKDPAVRCGFGQFLGRPLTDVPANFQEYAMQDAVATLRVYEEQLRRVARLGGENQLSEPLQVRAAIALHGLEKVGVAVDQEKAAKLQAAFMEALRPLETDLVQAGLGRWEPERRLEKRRIEGAHSSGAAQWYLRPDALLERVRQFKKHHTIETATPRFCLNTAIIQAQLEKLQVSDPDEIPRRDDGAISLDADYWAAEVPAGAPVLHAWLKHEKLKKVLTTYLSVYSQTPQIFPRWTLLGPRSGRMAASKPNLQNIPKRKAGIRALFVPHEGYLFTKADYSAQEMFTLAEAMLGMGIRGPLYQVLTSGKDIHDYGASLVLGKAYPVNPKNRQPGEVTKAERQAQKALHFGVPGGLGPRKLAAYAYSGYGVEWTIEEARARRERFLSVFTDIQEYLLRMKKSQDASLLAATGLDRRAWGERLGIESWNVIREMILHADPSVREAGLQAERQCSAVLVSGRQRTHCRFTEAANTYFQGTAADVTKAACWRAYLRGLRVVLVVHDEIVIESTPNLVHAEAATLEQCMLGAFREICPALGPYAKVEVESGLSRWGGATDIDGNTLDI